MDITHISVSRHDVWHNCQAQYKFKYHLKLEPEAEPPFYFIYGSIVHKIFEEYVLGRGELTLEAVAHDILSGKIPVEQDKQGNDVFAPPLQLEYKKRLPDHLNSIKKLSEQIGLEGQTEFQFKYDLDPPHGKNVVGFIDRLINKNDKWFVIDYKTTKKGSWRKDRNTILKDLQLRTYARVVSKTYDVPAKNINCALFYLEGGDLVGARYSTEALLDAERQLLKTYREIESTPPEKAWGNVGDRCRRCDYRKYCSFYKIT